MYYNKLGFKTLTEVQSKIKNLNNNILILSSCGSGKTEASYFKMLEHNNKTIIVEPMKTLANSIKDRLNSYNEKLKIENVTIQHSTHMEDRHLSKKYCVTTIDQILSGYLGMGKQSFIKGKNVLLSNLILDEVQLLDSERMLLTTINMLDEMHKLGNKFIIMTATMPEYLINLLKKRYNMDIIITQEERIDRNTKLYYKELDFYEINNYNKKQIIICNTTKQLNDIYENIDKDRVIVLNSRFTKTDRLKIEADVVKYFGKNSNDNNKILLTTQIVEAGMDISSDRLYSANCSIDSLIQRDGRCCRWGGNGEVIVFEADDKIYDKEVCRKVKEFILSNNGIDFTWEVQKDILNKILNEFYENRVNDRSIKKNKLDLKSNNRSKLIRDIENINIIVSNEDVISKKDFTRESIGVHINYAKKIASCNELYVLEKGIVKTTNFSKLETGDTVVIRGINCKYDELGFRYSEDIFIDNCCEFPITSCENNMDFDDYVEETWLEHATSVQKEVKQKLKEDKFNRDYVKENIDKISFYCGLHDLGKFDIEWLRKSPKDIPLAHFPFSKIKTDKRTHDYISAYVLKEYVDSIIFNAILQHHRKVNINDNIQIEVSRYDFHKDTRKILNDYGFIEDIKMNGKEMLINKKDIITPSNKYYTTFLYIVGTLMECEITAIKNNINLKTQKNRG